MEKETLDVLPQNYRRLVKKDTRMLQTTTKTLWELSKELYWGKKQKERKILILADTNPECVLGGFRTVSIIPPQHCAD